MATRRSGMPPANLMTPLLERLRRQRDVRERVRMWRLHYFVDVCRLLQFATVLQDAQRGQMSRAKRRALGAFLAADRSILTVARLGWRGARDLVGTPETLGAEWMLFSALAWRRLLSATATERPRSRLRLDALPPPSLILHPGRLEPGRSGPANVVADKIAPLDWAASDRARHGSTS